MPYFLIIRDLCHESLGDAITITSASTTTTTSPLSNSPCPYGGRFGKVQVTSPSSGSVSKGPFQQPDPHGGPQVQHLEVSPHYTMTDVIDVWELLSPLKNHSHDICLH